jgi:hypothetical protein
MRPEFRSIKAFISQCVSLRPGNRKARPVAGLDSMSQKDFLLCAVTFAYSVFLLIQMSPPSSPHPTG